MPINSDDQFDSSRKFALALATFDTHTARQVTVGIVGIQASEWKISLSAYAERILIANALDGLVTVI